MVGGEEKAKVEGAREVREDYEEGGDAPEALEG